MGGSFKEDATVRQLSKDMVSISLRKAGNDSRSAQGNKPPRRNKLLRVLRIDMGQAA